MHSFPNPFSCCDMNSHHTQPWGTGISGEEANKGHTLRKSKLTQKLWSSALHHSHLASPSPTPYSSCTAKWGGGLGSLVKETTTALGSHHIQTELKAVLRPPGTGELCAVHPAVPSPGQSRGEQHHQALLAVLWALQPREPSAFWASRTHCCHMVSCWPSAPTCLPILHRDDAGLAEAGWLQAAQCDAVGQDGVDTLPFCCPQHGQNPLPAAPLRHLGK